MDPARDWTRTHTPALDGRLILITGANSGVSVDAADLPSIRETVGRRRTAHTGAS